MQKQSLRKNFSWTFAGNIVYAASQWGIIVLLAKLGSPEVVGSFSYALALTAPVILFLNLKLNSAQATDQRRDYCFGHYLAIRILSTSMAVFVITSIAFFVSESTELLLSVLILGAAKGIESFSDIIHGLFQQEEQMDQISKSMMMRGLLSLIIVGILLIQTGNFNLSLTGLVGSCTFVLIFYDVPQARKILALRNNFESLRPIWDSKQLRSLVVLTFPLGVSMALGSLSVNIPRYFIEHQLGVYELGVFSAIAYFMVAGNTVVFALSQAVTPRLARLNYVGDYNAFKNLLLKIIFIGVLLGGGGIAIVWLFGREILSLFYTPEYAVRSDIFLWIMVASGITYSYVFLGSALNAMRLFRLQAYVSFFSIVLLSIGCFFVGENGLFGFVLAIIFVKAIEALIYVCIVLKLSCRSN